MTKDTLRYPTFKDCESGPVCNIGNLGLGNGAESTEDYVGFASQ